jgi:dimeric dUTPase (all-alpha-NTP-PPase superfamily)
LLQLKTENMFTLQKELDGRIENEHGLKKENLVQEKILALQVEIGELANETRCFKFWSLKPPSAKNVIVEEYVDGLHFILSLGIAFGYESNEVTALPEEVGLTERFLQVFDEIAGFRQHSNKQKYETLFSSYLALGKELGFSAEDVLHAYESKNEVNHVRQDTGY